MSRDVHRKSTEETESYVQLVEDITGQITGSIEEIPPIGVIYSEGIADSFKSLFSLRKNLFVDHVSLPGYSVSTGLPFAAIQAVEGVPFFCAEGEPYKGENMHQVALPVRIMGMLGIEVLIALSSACSLREDIGSGSVCILNDHINLLGNSPLVGHNIDQWGPRFPDMTEPYDLAMRQRCSEFVKEQDIPLYEGVLATVSESSRKTIKKDGYEYLRSLGADFVGIDVVPEVITARHMDLRVVGISCIDNQCSQPSHTKQDYKSPATKLPAEAVVKTLLKAIASFN